MCAWRVRRNDAQLVEHSLGTLVNYINTGENKEKIRHRFYYDRGIKL